MPYDFLTDPNGLNLREYQLNAIKAAEQSVIEGKKNILLAMATGTGKTRTVLGMIYRFLKTNRFKRYCFLLIGLPLENRHQMYSKKLNWKT